MQKIIKIVVGVLAFALIIVGVMQVTTLKANVDGLDIRSTNTQNPLAANSTTTRSYMNAGTGTTTITSFTPLTDEISLMVQFEGSSTAAVLGWQYEWSNDNVNWFEEDLPLSIAAGGTQANIDHASTTITHRWNPGTVATSSKAVRVPNIPARYTRVKFFIPIGGASGAVWAQMVNKSLNNQ